MSKRSKKENELLNYLSEDERKVYEEFEAKLKAKRDVAVKRQKKEIDEREEEVYQHIFENRKARNAEQKTEPVQTQISHQKESVPVENVVEQERENVTNSFYGQNQ